MKTISINRAPVLTLWASVVAERLGFNRDEALTLGKAVAGLNAQAKGRRLGILKPHERKPKEAREKAETFHIEICSRPVAVKNTAAGLRAVRGTQPIDPDSVRRYLESKFGDDLDAARSAMRRLARSFSPADLAAHAYSLYESFRPSIPAGQKGWGAKGELELKLISKLTPKN